jgi:hypothetical protein
MNDDIMQLDNAIREQKQKVNKLKSTINKLQTEAGQKLEYYNRMMVSINFQCPLLLKGKETSFRI